MALFLIACVSLIAGCGGSASDSTSDNASSNQRVTLYTSVDDAFAKMVVAQFEQETGIQVDLLGDTEATKTTGLVTRLQSEMNDPRCDVWWSSEPMGTILLDQGGVLEPNGMQGTVEGPWPEELHARNWSWVGTALRSRVIVYAPGRVQHPPTSMHELMDPMYNGRVGMARPQFGTTRIHMAMLASRWGPEGLEDWLRALKANGVRLYAGNATVVRAVAMGEIDVGLTDTDDVWSGQANGWDVEIARAEDSSDAPPESRFFLPVDQILIPNTVAVIRNAPHPEAAKRLAAYLVSPAVERMLYESTSGNLPVNQSLREELGLPKIARAFSSGPPELFEYESISGFGDEAMDVCERVLGP